MDSITANVQAFTPYNGGDSGRLAADSTTDRVPIPGLEGGLQSDKSRVVVTNPNAFSIFIRFGGASVTAVCTATRCSFEIIAGSSQLLKPPNIGPQPMYMAAITDGETGYISACAGEGT